MTSDMASRLWLGGVLDRSRSNGSPGYKQPRTGRKGDRGGPLAPDESESNAAQGVGPPSWQNDTDVIASDWMGLAWSDPYRLRDRLDISPPENGLYRIWYEDDDSSLAYIGESSNIPGRLHKHEGTFGGRALFAYAEDATLDAAHKRVEIETDLIGAHYLARDRPPLAQFGHDENLPDT